MGVGTQMTERAHVWQAGSSTNLVYFCPVNLSAGVVIAFTLCTFLAYWCLMCVQNISAFILVHYWRLLTVEESHHSASTLLCAQSHITASLKCVLGQP